MSGCGIDGQAPSIGLLLRWRNLSTVDKGWISMLDGAQVRCQQEESVFPPRSTGPQWAPRSRGTPISTTTAREAGGSSGFKPPKPASGGAAAPRSPKLVSEQAEPL